MIALADQEEVNRVVTEIKGLLPAAQVFTHRANRTFDDIDSECLASHHQDGVGGTAIFRDYRSGMCR
jgi:hypothetical protein